MSEIMTEFDFVLTQKFSYAHQGQQPSATFVTLKAPTSRNLKECAFLKQAFGRAQAALQDRAAMQSAITEGREASEDTKIEGDDVILMLAASTAVEYGDVLDVAKKLFSSGVAQIEGETKLTSPLIDSMSVEDFEGMLGQYLVNFTLASLLAKTNDQSSPAS